MAPMYENELFALLSGVLTAVPSVMFSVAGYVLTAVALYTMARRRGLRKPWLAWIPVVNVWLLGSLSDQYQYVVRRENKSKRKILLALNSLIAALGVAIASCVGVVLVQMTFGRDPEKLLGLIFGIIGMALPLAAVAIAYVVIRYMALYDVYKSMDPHNCVLFLVLSICFGVTEPFFLFFNRNKENGMPPRRQTAPQEAEPVREPWEGENTEY